MLADCLTATGDFGRALRYADLGVQAADASDLPHAQAFAYSWRANALINQGEFAQAVRWGERAVHLCETERALLGLPAAYAFWGSALAWSGRVAEGLPYLERGATIWESIGMKIYLSRFHLSWAEGLLLAGNVQEAKHTADKALELARAAGERGIEAQTLRLLGEISASGDSADFKSAATYYERANALASELGMRPLLARCHLGLGTLYRRTGTQGQAREHLTTAITMFREMDMRFWLEKAEAEMRELA